MKKKIKGFGIFVKAYGGLIGFSTDIGIAQKIKMTEFNEVSMSRSKDEFKIRPVTITYTLPKGKK